MVWRCEAGRSRTTPLEGLGCVQRSKASGASSVCDDRFRCAPTAQDKPRLLFRRAVHERFVVEPRTFAATAWMMSMPCPAARRLRCRHARAARPHRPGQPHHNMLPMDQIMRMQR